MACAVFDAVDGFHRGEHGVVHIVIPMLTVSADAEQIFKAAEIILHLVEMLIASEVCGIRLLYADADGIHDIGGVYHPDMLKLVFRKLDELVDFAGVERYLDTPVKRYSSGMTVRLGFAVAAFLEPEILVVDEVLTVGDAEFQKKAIGKMQDVSKGEGRTVLFVSHNMGSVQRLCSRGVLIENGRIKYIGDISETIRTYQSDGVVQSEFLGNDGNPEVLCLNRAAVSSNNGNVFYNSSAIRVEFEVTVGKSIPSLVIGFNLYSVYQHPLARADYDDKNNLTTLAPGTYAFVFEIPPYTLSNGSYTICFDVAERNIKRHTTERSNLTFSVVQGEDGFGNAFSEDMPIKSSIIREDWMKKYVKI